MELQTKNSVAKRRHIWEDNRGEIPGIAKLAIVALVIYIIATIAIPKFKESQIQKDKDNMAKLTAVLQESFANPAVSNFVPHGKGGMVSEYSMKDVMYYGGGGSSNALYDHIVEGVGKDFPDLLVTTKEDVKVVFVGYKNYYEIFLYAKDSSMPSNMLAHFYSPTTRGQVDPEGCKYKFYDAEDAEEAAQTTAP